MNRIDQDDVFSQQLAIELDKRRLLFLLLEKEFIYDQTKADRYKPNVIQKKFHETTNRIRLLVCGNKVGKCESFHTLISTSLGDRMIGTVFGQSCDVLTWPDMTPRKVLAWVRKPAEQCFRITLASGEWVEVPKGHRILTPSGFVSVAEILFHLPESVFSPPSSISGFALLTHVVSVGRWWRRFLDCLACCWLDFHLDDAQLLYDKDGVQVYAPLPIGAHKRIHISFCPGALARRCIHILRRAFFPLSSSDADPHSSVPFASILSPPFSCDTGYSGRCIENAPQSSPPGDPSRPSGELSRLQCRGAVAFEKSEGLNAFSPILTNGANKIVRVEDVGVKYLYDMQVEERHHYVSGGMIHHNTCAGVIETWRFVKQGGRVFRIVGSLGFARGIRDTIYPELLKWIPPDRIKSERRNTQGVVERMVLEGDNGHDSVISFLSGEQREIAFEGDIIDGAWIDEPPPRYIYIATLRALLVTNGPIWFTMTPMAEPWIYNDVFCSTDPDISCITGSMEEALTENGGHLSRNAMESFITKLDEDEIEPRVYGHFRHLVGRVYPTFTPEKHVVKPFFIPKQWPVWCAIDPHTRKPNVAIWVAISPEEVLYVINEVYWRVGIDSFGREVKRVSEQYNTVCTLIDTSGESPDWNRRATARSILLAVGVKTRLARKNNLKEPSRLLIKQHLSGISEDDWMVQSDRFNQRRYANGPLVSTKEPNEPTLKVFASCKRIQFEFFNYVYQDYRDPASRGVSEEPKKIHDDALDLLGYIVVEQPTHSTAPAKNIGWGTA